MESFHPSHETSSLLADKVREETFYRCDAIDEMQQLLETNYAGFETKTLVEKVDILKSVLMSLSETVGDTTEPVDNSKRFLVEALATKLHFLELTLNYQPVYH